MKLRALLLAMVAGCAFPRLDAKVPGHDRAWIAVMSGALDAPLDKVGRHAWIVASIPGEEGYRTWEYLGIAATGRVDDPLRHSYLPEVAVHGVIEDAPEVIKEKAECLDQFTESHAREKPNYRLVPGPNSNTFVARAMRACGVHAELPATAVGRDYLGPVGAAVTEAGTGVQIESALFGLRVGLREGVEVHLVGVALGVHFWPPGITVPINPGRIGIDLDGYAVRKDDHGDGEGSYEHEREYGLANSWMFLRGGRVRDRGFGGVGLSARALLAKRLGYALGIDLDLGMSGPIGLAYGTHFYPLGLAVAVGQTGMIGAFVGVGTTGVTGAIPFALETPGELRVELDLGSRLRVGARGVLIPTLFARTTPRFLDEWIVGGFARFGRTKRVHGATAGGGWFVGFERRDNALGPWWSATLGVEMNLGG